MARFLPDRITQKERRALERLSIGADAGAISPHILQRLVILGLVKASAGQLFLTYDGILFIGKEKPVG
jgi:hypothetical protein